MSSLSLEDFQEWERKLRGYDVHPYPVEPARPYLSIARGSTRPTIDDGRRPGLFASLLGATRAVEAAPPCPPPEPVPEARPREICELFMRAPEGFVVREDLGRALIETLRSARYPISFELLGSPSGVEAQWAVSPDDENLLRESLDAFYPEVRLDLRFGHLARAYRDADEDVFVTHIDFGLAGDAYTELGVVRSLSLDPYIAVARALESTSEADEFALLQVLFERADERWSVECLAALEALDAPRDVLALAKRKLTGATYAASISLSAWSPSEDRLDRIVKSVGHALIAATRGDENMLMALDPDGYTTGQHSVGMLRRTSRRSGMLLSADELFSFVHVPASSVRARSLARLKEARTKQAPVIALGLGVSLGVNEHDGEEREVSLSVAQRLRHTYVIGSSGTGKSTLLLSLVLQDIEAGRGVALLDPHGDLADEVLARVPEARIEDVVLLDPSDEDFPVGLNVLGAASDRERRLLASDLSAVFRRMSTSWGDQMHTVLSQAVIAILERPEGGTLLDLRRFLVDARFRSEHLKGVRDRETVFYWTREFPLLKGNPQASILTRLDSFLRTKPVRYMVAQKERSLDFRRILDEQKILICRLSQGAIGEENAYLLGSLIVSKLQQAALSRQDQEARARNPFFLYIDEFHHFVTPSLASLLSGVRKYGVGLTLAHQNLEQISGRDAEVSAATLANAATRVVFRVGDADARKLEGGFSFFEASDLQSLVIGQAIVRVERSDFDFNLRTELLPALASDEAARRREATRDVSRASYATPRAEVEALLEATRGEVEAPTHRAELRAKTRAARPRDEVEPLEPPQGEGKPQSIADARGSRNPTSSDPEAPATQLRSDHNLRGRGGVQHKYLQDFVRKLGEDRGFTVQVEQAVLGTRGHVDVAVILGDLKIGCEISVTNTPAHEAENLSKCLASGFDYAVLLSSDEKTLARVQRQLEEEGSDTRFRFCTPNQLCGFLDGIALARKLGGERGVSHPGDSEDATFDSAEAAAYVGLARQTLAKMRVTGESPPYFKLGSRIVYRKSDLDFWLSERRRRSTADRAK